MKKVKTVSTHHTADSTISSLKERTRKQASFYSSAQLPRKRTRPGQQQTHGQPKPTLGPQSEAPKKQSKAHFAGGPSHQEPKNRLLIVLSLLVTSSYQLAVSQVERTNTCSAVEHFSFIQMKGYDQCVLSCQNSPPRILLFGQTIDDKPIISSEVLDSRTTSQIDVTQYIIVHYTGQINAYIASGLQASTTRLKSLKQSSSDARYSVTLRSTSLTARVDQNYDIHDTASANDSLPVKSRVSIHGGQQTIHVEEFKATIFILTSSQNTPFFYVWDRTNDTLDKVKSSPDQGIAGLRLTVRETHFLAGLQAATFIRLFLYSDCSNIRNFSIQFISPWGLLYLDFTGYFVAKPDQANNIQIFLDSSSTSLLTFNNVSRVRIFNIFEAPTGSAITPGVYFIHAAWGGQTDSVKFLSVTGLATNQLCDSSCLACTGNSSSQCLVCKPGNYINPHGSAGTCSNTCNAACTQCRGPLATDCVPGECAANHQQVGLTGECQICASNTYYRASDKSCQPCNGACLTCAIGTGLINECLTCPANQYFVIATGSQGTCPTCDSSCGGNCSGAGYQNCGPKATSCATGFQLAGTQCRRVCQANEYWRASDNSCQPCSSTCASCVISSSSPGLATECLTCPANYYVVIATGSQGACTLCDSTCGGSCSGAGYQNCGPKATSCATGFQLIGTQCRRVCSSNQYWRESDNSCQPCHGTCATCEIGTGLQTECRSCPTGKYFTLQSSPKGICSDCDISCGGGGCTGATFNQCNETGPCAAGYSKAANSCLRTCQNGQYFERTTNSCRQCEGTHSECTGPSYKQSIKCNPGYILEKITECRKICQKGKFWNSKTNDCGDCPQGCQDCLKTENQANSIINECLKCLPGYKLMNKECIRECLVESKDETTYAEFLDKEENTCLRCDLSCQSCTGPSSHDCTKCKNKLFVQQDLSCQSTCKPGSYGDLKTQKCLKCHNDCQTCSGPSQNECLSCWKDPIYTHKIDQNRCINCSVDYKQFPGDCQSTLELQVNFMKISPQDKKDKIQRIKVTPTTNPDQIKLLKQTIKQEDWLNKYLSLQVTTQDSVVEQVDLSRTKRRQLQTKSFSIVNTYDQETGVVEVQVKLNNPNEELKDLVLSVKESLLLHQNSGSSSSALMIAKKKYNLKQPGLVYSKSSTAAAASLEENKEKTNAVTGAINAVSGASSAASIVASTCLSTLLGTFLGILFKFFQVMDNIGNLQLVNVEYGPFMTKIFEIIDSIQLSPDLEPDTWVKKYKRKQQVYNKTREVTGGNFEDGHLLSTVPFGSVLYFLVNILFRVVNLIRRKAWGVYWQKKREIRKQNTQKTGSFINTKKINRQRRILKCLDKVQGLLYEIKAFVFNLFVLDLTLGGYYEMVSTDLQALFSVGSSSPMVVVSYVVSLIVLVFIFYEFWELIGASREVKLSKQAQEFLEVRTMLIERERNMKKHAKAAQLYLDNENSECSLNNGVELIQDQNKIYEKQEQGDVKQNTAQMIKTNDGDQPLAPPSDEMKINLAKLKDRLAKDKMKYSQLQQYEKQNKTSKLIMSEILKSKPQQGEMQEQKDEKEDENLYQNQILISEIKIEETKKSPRFSNHDQSQSSTKETKQQKKIINQKYPAFKAFMKENQLEEEEMVVQRLDVIEQKLQNSVLDGLNRLTFAHGIIRNYNAIFLIRYLIFGILLIGLQLVQRAQILMILAVQLIFWGYFSYLLVKYRFFEERYSYWAFFIQEGALSFFLLMTTLLVLLQWGGIGVDPDSLFKIELLQALAIACAFLVEVIGLLIAILDLIVRFFILIFKKCCQKKQGEGDDHKEIQVEQIKEKSDKEENQEEVSLGKNMEGEVHIQKVQNSLNVSLQSGKEDGQ